MKDPLNVKLTCLNTTKNFLVIFLLCLLSLLFSIGLRFDFQLTQMFVHERFSTPLIYLFVSYLIAHWICHLEPKVNRYISYYEVMEYLKLHLLASFFWASSIFLLRVPYFPRSVIFLQFIVSLSLQIAPSIIYRFFMERKQKQASMKFKEKKALIVGAGEAGTLLVRMLKQHHQLRINPIGLLDDSNRLQNSKIYGIPVIGKLADLPMILDCTPGIDSVLLSIFNLSSKKVSELVKICDTRQIAFKKVQSFDEIVVQDVLRDLQTIDEGLLLARDIETTHSDEIASFYQNKIVLVTGGAGSIGSELVRQLLKFHISKIVVVDNCEFNLFKLERELGQQQIEYQLRDVRSETGMKEIISFYKPKIIFHAAAYKHVPLAETNAKEVFHNNVIATDRLCKIARQNNVENFVLISSDKAVYPVGIMGATKRLAETIILSTSDLREGLNDLLKCSVVRFGNVLNSTGSVLPLFREQIIQGGPITVTHPEMERYFMSIKEAVHLVITATVISDENDMFVLDMGKKIKILTIAQRMIELLGKQSIEIKFTGVRPGERLTEDITEKSEELEKTSHPKIFKIKREQQSNTTLITEIHQLNENSNFNSVKFKNKILNLVKFEK